MADWTELQADGSESGGLIFWEVEIPEGRDVLLELGAVVTDSAGAVYDWTACTEPVANIYDVASETVVAALTWVPRADGTFAFTASRTVLADKAGSRAAFPAGRSLAWSAKVTVPGGLHVQLVAESPVTIRHKGV
ncbi:hypothetical protein [Janibacter terrae]|uniref:hypothetical protein n=1 Tax=Janibacter terrae TaxID=103817 RepID=UPI0031F7A4D7